MIGRMRCIILFYMICGTFAVKVEGDAYQDFVHSIHRFTSAVYKEILKQKSGNFIASPLSAEIVLALTNEAARGVTSTELVTALSLPSSRETTQNALKSFLPSLNKSDEDTKLLSANKMYIANDLKLELDFRSTANNAYSADIENIDFSKNVEASGKINEWAAATTNGKIKGIISPENIDDSTRIILLNAIYFKGKWHSKFDKQQTKMKKFFKTDADYIETKTMHKLSNFKYSESAALNAKFLELPYKGGDISMVIVLPNEIGGLASLEQNIEQILSPQPFGRQKVDVELPKFTIETQLEFVSILKNLGVSKLFSVDSDLTGLSSTDKNLTVSNIIQKAYIKVGEAGTEAAVVTGVSVIYPLSARIDISKTYDFHADHPFLYFIKLKETILFIGRYVDPKEK